MEDAWHWDTPLLMCFIPVFGLGSGGKGLGFFYLPLLLLGVPHHYVATRFSWESSRVTNMWLAGGARGCQLIHTETGFGWGTCPALKSNGSLESREHHSPGSRKAPEPVPHTLESPFTQLLAILLGLLTLCCFPQKPGGRGNSAIFQHGVETFCALSEFCGTGKLYPDLLVAGRVLVQTGGQDFKFPLLQV